jgi:predicted  nucleic acid-binding Zn-ribbon protein
MSDEPKISNIADWLSVFKILGGVLIACSLFYLNSTYVKKDDFVPVAREIKVQAEQVSYVNAEVKNISRRLSKIVDDDGNPVNTDKMVEIQRDITKILVKLENLSDKINNLEKKK